MPVYGTLIFLIHICKWKQVIILAMPLDSVITSPHRRSQTQTVFSPPSLKRQHSSREDELGSCSTLLQRHRFLLTALALLAFLCTIYLYFAVTLGAARDSCAEMSGAQKASCHLQQVKAAVAKERKL
ncbi:unnamed protein product [Fraxinus pennsylvanica]|uniref:Uncharacterized protein n=1 Tax=Fraxinus pennsylvanica TaxID=56036 RepID=A0AAD2DXR9_9LAMI|nr:unnamed protein product [Fraxinus pennsylvanica]